MTQSGLSSDKRCRQTGLFPREAFVLPCSGCFPHSPGGAVLVGRARCLPSAGEIQQTPTRQPTETQQNKQPRWARPGGESVLQGRPGGECRHLWGGWEQDCVLWPGAAAWGCQDQRGGAGMPAAAHFIRLPNDSPSCRGRKILSPLLIGAVLGFAARDRGGGDVKLGSLGSRSGFPALRRTLPMSLLPVKWRGEDAGSRGLSGGCNLFQESSL